MREVQVFYGRDAMGAWSARITGAFDAKCKGKNPEAARQAVDAALESHGGHSPYETRRDPASGGETITYA